MRVLVLFALGFLVACDVDNSPAVSMDTGASVELVRDAGGDAGCLGGELGGTDPQRVCLDKSFNKTFNFGSSWIMCLCGSNYEAVNGVRCPSECDFVDTPTLAEFCTIAGAIGIQEVACDTGCCSVPGSFELDVTRHDAVGQCDVEASRECEPCPRRTETGPVLH